MWEEHRLSCVLDVFLPVCRAQLLTRREFIAGGGFWGPQSASTNVGPKYQIWAVPRLSLFCIGVGVHACVLATSMHTDRNRCISTFLLIISMASLSVDMCPKSVRVFSPNYMQKYTYFSWNSGHKCLFPNIGTRLCARFRSFTNILPILQIVFSRFLNMKSYSSAH